MKPTIFIFALLLSAPVTLFSQNSNILQLETCKAEQDAFFKYLKRDTINYQVDLQENIIVNEKTLEIWGKQYRISTKTDDIKLAEFLGFPVYELSVITKLNGKNVVWLEAVIQTTETQKVPTFEEVGKELPTTRHSIGFEAFDPYRLVFEYDNRYLKYAYMQSDNAIITVMSKKVNKNIINWLDERRRWELKHQ